MTWRLEWWNVVGRALMRPRLVAEIMLQGPILIIAEKPANGLVEALSAAGAFPIVESTWVDAPTAFLSIKPSAVIVAGPGAPPSEASARLLGLQIVTAEGPLVPAIAMAEGAQEIALPVALSADASLPVERLIARMNTSLRVRALHATVLRRIETCPTEGGMTPALPSDDPLNDATVLIAGRGPLYPGLSVALGEHVTLVGALSVENAARHLNARDIDGVVVGDGFSPRMVEAFLTVLAQEPRFRDIPITVIGEAPDDSPAACPISIISAAIRCGLYRACLPLVRMHAFEIRLKRMLASLDAGGLFDPDSGLLTHEAFWRELPTVVAEAADRSQPLSIARLAFEGIADLRAGLDGARMLARLIRPIDFATREDDGVFLLVCTQMDLRSALVVMRRMAGALRSAFVAWRPPESVTVNVTLATFKAGDTLDSLMLRVMGSRVVAAE
jgi:hypothetical protein